MGPVFEGCDHLTHPLPLAHLVTFSLIPDAIEVHLSFPFNSYPKPSGGSLAKIVEQRAIKNRSRTHVYAKYKRE